LRQLPPAKPLDSRLQIVIQSLVTDPAIPVDELARRISLSADRLSHLFTDEIGVDLRRYRLWLKLGRAILFYIANPALNFTVLAQQAGFSDSAHFSRAFKEMYGGSPTDFATTTTFRLALEDSVG
jgi:AraC-like DNA-binding protein